MTTQQRAARAGQGNSLVPREHDLVGTRAELTAILRARHADGTLLEYTQPEEFGPDAWHMQARILTPAPASWLRRHWWQAAIALTLVLAAGGYMLYRAVSAMAPHWEVPLALGVIGTALYLAKRHDLAARR